MRVGKMVLVICVFAWAAILLAQKIDLTTADLGRHIKNGELLVTGDKETRRSILTQNFYSYTAPDEPFVNHHWGTGVVFYLAHAIAGFTGLHIFFLALFLLALFFAFETARRAGGVWIASALLLFLLPLIAVRSEVRPEVFSYLFSAFFVWVLFRYACHELSYRWLYALPAVSLLWVNLHIGFVFGIFIAGVFLVVCRTRALLLTFIGVTLATLFNPIGIAGALYPLHIFKGYGYRVLENQSVWFLESLGIRTGYDFLLFKIAVVFVMVGFGWCVWKCRTKEACTLGIIMFAFGILAGLGVRHFPSFALVALPFCALVYAHMKLIQREWGMVLLILIAVLGVWRGAELQGQRGIHGFGLVPENEKAGEFLRMQLAGGRISGPIFNNYDIGGYLIYYLAPDTKVFTDNRPEAYPADFFNTRYIPAQERAEVFDMLDKEYQFGAVVFQHRDATPWTQTFLQRAVADSRFEQAFLDERVIVLLRK